jgi:hypothetical protein
MQNLRDKLLKAGLVTDDQAKKAETETQKRPAPAQARPPPPGRPPGHAPDRNTHRPRPSHHAETPRREAPIPKLPPMPGSREHQRLVSKKQVELDRKLRELVTSAQVAIEPGTETFYFVTRKQRLRRLELTPAQKALLESGALAVVERPDPGQIEHALVPAETAVKLLELSEKSVRFLNKGEQKVGFLSDDELKTAQDNEASGAAAASEAEQNASEAAAEQAAGEEPTPSA